jgi:predicted DNA-binding transcriptional regulator AlpA
MDQSILANPLVTAKGLSALLGHSTLRTISNWLYLDARDSGSRAPKHIKINGRVYFRVSSVDAWLASQSSAQL